MIATHAEFQLTDANRLTRDKYENVCIHACMHKEGINENDLGTRSLVI